MAMKICGYDFEGPFDMRTTVIPLNRTAVYVIVYQGEDGQCFIKDVGISGETCWERNCEDSYAIYLRYMPSTDRYTPGDRQSLERKIRERYNLPPRNF